MARDYTAYWLTTSDGDGAAGQDSADIYDDTQGAEVFFSDFLDPAFVFYDPKTDWTAADEINAEDFNAIESNVDTVSELLEAIQYDMPTLTTVTNRTQTYVDTLTSINRVETNLDSVRAAFLTPPGYGVMETWVVGKGFDFNDANRLENDLKLLFEYGSLVHDSYRYCGAATCGDGGGLI